MPEFSPATNEKKLADRKWRRFCRRGWRWAGIGTVLWMSLMFLLLGRISHIPPAVRELPSASLAWWSNDILNDMDADEEIRDLRSVWTPSVFALSTPVGFTADISPMEMALPPPMDRPVLSPAYLEEKEIMGDELEQVRQRIRAEHFTRIRHDMNRRLPTPASSPVFESNGTSSGSALSNFEFPEGWQLRMFSGVNVQTVQLGFNWVVQAEMTFDAVGIPTSIILLESSGLSEVDRRLIRSLWEWRLLDSHAMRRGTIRIRAETTTAMAKGE